MAPDLRRCCALSSPQFLVLRLRLLQDGQVRIGVLPCGKEVLVGGLGRGRIALQSERPSQAQMRKTVAYIQRGNAAVVEDLLVLGRRLRALFQAQEGFTANIVDPVM